VCWTLNVHGAVGTYETPFINGTHTGAPEAPRGDSNGPPSIVRKKGRVGTAAGLVADGCCVVIVVGEALLHN
jgi:hypothetical protein